MKALREVLVDTIRALGFLSRIPLSDRWFEGFDGRYERAARMMPLAGAVATVPSVLVLLAMVAVGADSLIASILTVACGLLVAGALHEDGLADAFDGLGAREPARRLAIMRDSSVGVYGVCALALAIGLRVAMFASLAVSATGAAAALLAGAAVGRAGMVYLWGTTNAAEASGAAASAGKPLMASVRIATALGTAIAVPSVLLYGPVTAVASAFLVFGVIRIARARLAQPIGGHTGDILGATAVLCELAWLLPLAVAA